MILTRSRTMTPSFRYGMIYSTPEFPPFCPLMRKGSGSILSSMSHARYNICSYIPTLNPCFTLLGGVCGPKGGRAPKHSPYCLLEYPGGEDVGPEVGLWIEKGK